MLRRLRKRVALTVSIPAVILFVGLLVALVVPSNLMVLTEALDDLGLLGGRQRIAGLVERPPGQRVPPPLAIVNGAMWDAEGGLRPNPGLRLEGGRIAETAPGAAPIPPGTRVIDATGLTILPGLIDMHVHAFGGTFADEMMIGNGVTTARDLGTQMAVILRHRLESSRGGRIGPRLFVTGPYLVSGAWTGDKEVSAPGPAAATAVVARLAASGADGIKVHTGIDAATLRAVVAEAHARGLWVAAHLDRVGAVEAAACGIDTLEHASGVDLDSDAGQQAAAEALVAARVALTPTLVVAEHAFTVADLGRGGSPSLEFVPRLLRRFWISSQVENAGAGNLSVEEIARRRERLRRLEQFVLRFRRAGGRVLAGTDAPAFLVAPGFDIHRELELLVEAGLGPEEALASATREAAAALGHSGDLGGLAPGMRADLILVSGNPLDGAGAIGATRHLLLVVKDGEVYLDRLGQTRN